MSVLTLLNRLESAKSVVWIRESNLGFAILISVHALSLGVFLGTAIAMDLRLLARGVRTAPVSDFVGHLLPWTRGAFAILAASGTVLFVTEAVKCYQSSAFRIKMLLIVLAGINIWVFHRQTYSSVQDWDIAPEPAVRVRLAGALSLVFWIGALAAGRAVGYDL